MAWGQKERDRDIERDRERAGRDNWPTVFVVCCKKQFKLLGSLDSTRLEKIKSKRFSYRFSWLTSWQVDACPASNSMKLYIIYIWGVYNMPVLVWVSTVYISIWQPSMRIGLADVGRFRAVYPLTPSPLPLTPLHPSLPLLPIGFFCKAFSDTLTNWEQFNFLALLAAFSSCRRVAFVVPTFRRVDNSGRGWARYHCLQAKWFTSWAGGCQALPLILSLSPSLLIIIVVYLSDACVLCEPHIKSNKY